MPDYSKFARGIDFYVAHEIDWDVVMPKIDFGIAKCSQSTFYKDSDFAKTVEIFYKADKPLLAFHYYDGKYYPSLQFDYNDDTKWVPADKDLQLINMTDSIKFKKIYGLAIDLEEFGNENVPNSWMSKGARVFCGRSKDWLEANKPSVKQLIYSRQTYINEHAPDINNWIHKYDTWVAQWVWGKGEVRSTWDNLPIPPSDTKVGYLGASTTWKFWQYSGDRFILPGVRNNQLQARTIDLDYFNGTVEQLYEYLNFVPGQVIIPPVTTGTKFAVQTKELNVRAEPKLNSPSLGKLTYGSVVYITEFTENSQPDGYVYRWGKHKEGWSAINRYKPSQVYMKEV